MTDHRAFIDNTFAEHMEAVAETASELSDTITATAEALVNALLNEGRILACANGTANVLAQYFCTCLLNRLDQERPALPAINLGADATTYAAICRDNRFNDTFSRQVRALGKEQDILLVIVDDGHKANLIQAIQAAHDRQMRVVVISAREGSDIMSLLHPEDYEIALHNLTQARATEVTLLIINAICALIDQMLFGV